MKLVQSVTVVTDSNMVYNKTSNGLFIEKDLVSVYSIFRKYFNAVFISNWSNWCGESFQHLFISLTV